MLCKTAGGSLFLFGEEHMANKCGHDGSNGDDRPWNDASLSPSDTELLYVTLEIDDPRALANRVGRIPEGVTAVRLEQAYKCSDKLRCANPGCSAWHNKGYIARLSNEQVANIGHICGSQLFPGVGNWEQQRATLEWRIKRQGYLKRIAPLDRNIVSALAILETWDRPFYLCRTRREFFRDFCYAFYTELQNAARAGGLLKVQRRKSKNIADELLGKGTAGGYLDTIGQLRGTAIFLNPGPFQMLRDAETKLKQILGRLGARALRNDEMSDLLQQVRQVADSLKEAHSRYLAMGEFTTEDHLKLLTRFALASTRPWRIRLAPATGGFSEYIATWQDGHSLVKLWGPFKIEQLDLTVIDLLLGTKIEEAHDIA